MRGMRHWPIVTRKVYSNSKTISLICKIPGELLKTAYSVLLTMINKEEFKIFDTLSVRGLKTVAACIDSLGNSSQKGRRIPIKDSLFTHAITDAFGGNASTMVGWGSEAVRKHQRNGRVRQWGDASTMVEWGSGYFVNIFTLKSKKMGSNNLRKTSNWQLRNKRMLSVTIFRCDKAPL